MWPCWEEEQVKRQSTPFPCSPTAVHLLNNPDKDETLAITDPSCLSSRLLKGNLSYQPMCGQPM